MTDMFVEQPRLTWSVKYHGYSISSQSYEFYSHLAQLEYLYLTLSHIESIVPMKQHNKHFFIMFFKKSAGIFV